MSEQSLGRIRPYSGALVEFGRGVDAVVIVATLWLVSHRLGYPWEALETGLAWFAALAFILCGSVGRLYRSWRSEPLHEELGRIALCWCAAAVVTGFAAFLVAPLTDLPRALALWWFLATPLALGASRVAIRTALRIGRIRGHNYRRTAIVGSTRIAVQIAESMIEAPWMGLRFVGYYDDRRPVEERIDPRTRERLLGDMERLIRDVLEGDVDRVYITLPLRAEIRIKDLIDRLAETPVEILYVPDFFIFSMLRAQWEQIGTLNVVNVVTTPFLGVSGVAKRIEDIVLASLILAVIAAPMAVIAAAVKLTSPGPVIFRQRRYGLNGNEFEIWKFRTMTVMEDGAQFVQAKRGDRRVTPLGRFLRGTSLDELPQFLNVLRGDMSIVGPRPHPVALDEQHRRLIPRYYFRHRIRPGITGLAQVSGFRGETDTLDKMEKRIEHDIRYIDQWSLLLDLRIIWLTVMRGFRDRNAV